MYNLYGTLHFNTNQNIYMKQHSRNKKASFQFHMMHVMKSRIKSPLDRNKKDKYMAINSPTWGDREKTI